MQSILPLTNIFNETFFCQTAFCSFCNYLSKFLSSLRTKIANNFNYFAIILQLSLNIFFIFFQLGNGSLFTP